MKALKWKVCGLKDAGNIEEVLSLEPDYIGFIFYEQSPRYVGNLSSGFAASIASAKKVGVFVNAEVEMIEKAIAEYGLDAVQLHGEEEVSVCKHLKNSGLEVLKAFGISPAFDWSVLDGYVPVVDYFLFDTKHCAYGGSGQVFDWSLLKSYRHDVPYFLSGGLDVHHIGELLQIEDNRFYAVDVNSRFEISPGMKDVALLREAMALLERKD